MRTIYKTRHARFLLNLHIVWVPKYRAPILGPYRAELTMILRAIAEDKGWEILAVEVMPDHVHLFVSVPPAVAPSEVVKCFKGQSARKLLIAHPEIKSKERYNTLWAASYFVASAGDVSSETIQKYIEGQYD